MGGLASKIFAPVLVRKWIAQKSYTLQTRGTVCRKLVCAPHSKPVASRRKFNTFNCKITCCSGNPLQRQLRTVAIPGRESKLWYRNNVVDWATRMVSSKERRQRLNGDRWESKETCLRYSPGSMRDHRDNLIPTKQLAQLCQPNKITKTNTKMHSFSLLSKE